MMPRITKPGVPDRSCRGPQRPRVSAGRHAPSPTEPEQLRGPKKPASQGRATKEDGMTTPPVFVGIDVSTAQLDLALRPEGRFAGSNDEAGRAQILERLKAVRPVLVVLEATGGLEIPLTGALAAAGVPVVVVHPRQVRDFAKATGQLAKTDALDAQVLAQCAEVLRPAPRPLPDAQTQTLAALLTRRRQLVEMLTAEKNRLASAPTPVRTSLRTHITWLERELAHTDRALAAASAPASGISNPPVASTTTSAGGSALSRSRS